MGSLILLELKLGAGIVFLGGEEQEIEDELEDPYLIVGD